MISFGSVCSGIEAASVAFHPLGWQTAWLSEIEAFPNAVLAYHYPDIQNLGDMTTLPERILKGEVSAPDVFVGGTPCQGFSVSGLRKGLNDPRGRLTLTFIEIANAIDTVRSKQGKEPCIILWENVPGVYSDKTNAFGNFLAGLSGEEIPLEPAGGKWTNAGVVLGKQRAVGWRTLDAQYFGVAQRRRRCFLVASARDGFCPAEILFERQGVSGYTESGKTEGKEASRATETCLRDGGEQITYRRLSNCEYAEDNRTSSIRARDYKDVTDLITSCFPLDMRNAMRDPEKHDSMNRQGVGIGEDGDPSQTITSAFVHGVAIVDAFGIDQELNIGSNIFGTLMAKNKAGGFERSVSYVNDAKDCSVVHWAQGGGETEDCLSGTLRAGAEHNYQFLRDGMSVRRLTPVECERLQGFPDGYTKVPFKGKSAEDCPDSPRYKALGNSWAVPCAAWVGKRIDNYLKGIKNEEI